MTSIKQINFAIEKLQTMKKPDNERINDLENYKEFLINQRNLKLVLWGTVLLAFILIGACWWLMWQLKQ